MRLKLYKQKRTQSIAINTIIIVAIALAVLVVTFIIFTGQSSSTAKNLQSCESKGGKCASKLGYGDENGKPMCGGDNPVPIILNDPECGESKLCCLKIG